MGKRKGLVFLFGALTLGLAFSAALSIGFLRASDHDDGELDTKGRNVNLTDLFVFREVDQNPSAKLDDLIFVMDTNTTWKVMEF